MATRFVRSVVKLLATYCWAALIFVAVLAWVSYELRIIGAWVAGSLTQTVLCAVLIHLMLCIGDFDYYNAQTRPMYCESCTMWFRVEYLLALVQAVILVFVAPHWPLAVLAVAGVAYDTYVCCYEPEKRTLDPLTIYKHKSVLVRQCVWKVSIHALLFLLYLFYIGPWIIMYNP